MKWQSYIKKPASALYDAIPNLCLFVALKRLQRKWHKQLIATLCYHGMLCYDFLRMQNYHWML